MQYSAVQYIIVQYSIVQYSAEQCSAVHYSTVQYSTVQCITVECCAVQYSTVQCSAIHYSTVQYSTYTLLLLCRWTFYEERWFIMLFLWNFCNVLHCNLIYFVYLWLVPNSNIFVTLLRIHGLCVCVCVCMCLCLCAYVFLCMYVYVCVYIYIYIYIGCPGGNVPDFGRMFLTLKYTDVTQNTYVYIRSWTVTEIMETEFWNFDSCYTLIDY